MVCDGVEVSNLNSQMEERRATYGTHKNINQWFTILKEVFLEMGFARLPTDEEIAGGHKGELYFPPEQLQQIINVDENGAVTGHNNDQVRWTTCDPVPTK
eukprot:jgi/Psemu1/21381/gm1.21381_g